MSLNLSRACTGRKPQHGRCKGKCNYGAGLKPCECGCHRRRQCKACAAIVREGTGGNWFHVVPGYPGLGTIARETAPLR